MLLSLLLLIPLAADPTVPANRAAADELFQHRVLPLLRARCLPCHGGDPKKIQGGLDLRTAASSAAGGDSGPAVVPGEPKQSRLFVAVTRQDPSLQMPPKDNDRLSAEEIGWIRDWIQAGARWSDPPDATSPHARSTTNSTPSPNDLVRVATSGGLSPDWDARLYKPDDIWCFQPIRRPAVPTDPAGKPAAHPIDAFLDAKRLERGIDAAAPRADKRTFLRRATLDLTGLPPQPDDIERFAADDSPNAARNLVQRLLDSPHYGEQQARHWLDVVRYADTSGFSNDYERPNAWRYRDYAIRSFNQDKPFDRFIVEQVAGDELDSSDPELLVAAGFLRMGPWEHTGMTVAAVTRQQFLDDVTHHVAVVFLGQGLRCARCHDHKFDPIPTRDYYRMQAVFAATQLAERPVPFMNTESPQSDSSARRAIERRLQETNRILAQLNEKNRLAVERLLAEHGVKKVSDLPRDSRDNKAEIGLTKDDLSVRKLQQKRRDYFERELRRFEPDAFSVYSGPPNNYTSNKLLNGLPAKREGNVPEVQILSGGALESPLAAVTPGVLSAMDGSHDAVRATAWNTIPQEPHGRRLALARWIASANNTLTARVIVNRIWQQHFGTGLVATPNNFGQTGSRPTHPELLDWLATWFIDHGWSIKKLHALIMSSEAYQRSGRHPDMRRLLERDPKNELLAVFPPRRLAAEELRDAMLAASGELNRDMGGPGVFPEIHWEVAFQPRHIMGSVAPAYQPSATRVERSRRTIYAFRYRTLPDPMLELFNRPGSEVSCERRDESTVTPQVFTLFQGEFANNRARALAAAIERQTDSREDQVVHAFRAVYGRAPAETELRDCIAHLEEMTHEHRRHPPEPAELPRSVKRHMVEEMTGEEFAWEEQLDGFDDYERDLMAWEVSPETRALADLCLVLFNSNEFLYVR